MSKIISIIGLRAFPSDFVGTSGVEAYVQKIIISSSLKQYNFKVYVKSCYQSKSNPSNLKIQNNVELKIVFTFISKIFESVIYGFLSSMYCFFDDSTTVWYQGLGMAIWSWIPHLRGKKILITVHSLDWERKKWDSFQNYIFKKISLEILRRKYYQLVVVSSKIESYLIENYLNKKIEIIKPGYDSFPLRATDNLKRNFISETVIQDKYLLFLGRFVPEKNIEGLIKEFILLRNSGEKISFKLVLAGGSLNMGDYEEKIVKLSKKNSDIIRLGYVFGRRKQNLIENCYAMVLPSFLEGNPVVLYEAISLGKRCIVSQNWLDEEFENHDLIFKANINKKYWLRDALVAIDKSARSKTTSKNDSIGYRSWDDSAKAYLKYFF